ncbi:DUF1501 domain-containing protein [Stieleria sp. JC731]|nr:DUF1501 domain-containing protein [Stieleria sp. JC731]
MIKRGLVASSALAVQQNGFCPALLCQAAEQARTDQNILVVVELAGGNDGLNTVVPHSHEAYVEARPNLRIRKDDCLSITEDVGFHPSLKGFASLLEQGQFSIVHGIGYPNPNRSHFESMDIWHSCRRKEENRPDGWIGRYLQTLDSSIGHDPLAIHLGHEQQPFALMSRDVRVPSIESLQQFRLRKNGSVDLPQAIGSIASSTDGLMQGNELLSFIQSSTTAAIATNERMKEAKTGMSSDSSFPKTGLGKKLQTVADLIASDLQTRVYYVRLDGFDTHANQPDAHAALLREVGDAVTSFVDRMNQSGDSDRVLVMCFSEFGRRVAENASDGTDHGTAAPVFFAGGKVKPGQVGERPSLTDLDEGDLKYHTDFRSVYATVLERWLECPSQPILGKAYPQIDFIG